MFDRYNYIKSFCHFKTLEKRFEKFNFYYYNGAQKHDGFVGFEKACSRAKTYVILTSLNYVHFYTRYCWWRQFLWWSRMCICKVQKPCINSTWIAKLIHGFLSIKTWLLKAWDMAFYAIIKVKMSLHLHPHSTLCMRAANTLVRLHISAGLPDRLMLSIAIKIKISLW